MKANHFGSTGTGQRTSAEQSHGQHGGHRRITPHTSGEQAQHAAPARFGAGSDPPLQFPELPLRVNAAGRRHAGVPIAPDPSVFLFMRGIAARQAARASRSPAGQASVRSRTSRALSSFSERVRMSVFDFMSYGLSTGNGGMFLTDQQIFFLRRASRIFCTAWPRCTSRVLTEI